MSKSRKYKILIAIGTRPEAIKLAPLVFALKKERSCRVLVCNTAQHRQMVDGVLDLFGIKSDFDLDVMRPDQTLVYVQNTVMERFSRTLTDCGADMVVVQGDTTTAFAAALSAFYHKVPVAHVEAGLRTFDRRNPFPEEINRRMISVCGDLHFAPTILSRQNLIREGIAPGSVHVVGNTVVDALGLMLFRLRGAAGQPVQKKFLFVKDYGRLILVTAHRRENWGAPLVELCSAVKRLALRRSDCVILWPVHPHPRVKTIVEKELTGVRNVFLLQPLSYDEFVYLLNGSYLVITDSGGVQEESASMGKPVLVFRKTTERPEVLQGGAGELVPCASGLLYKRVAALLDNESEYRKRCRKSLAFGRGNSSEQIVKIMVKFLGMAEVAEGKKIRA